ncbi:hypothetical protein V8C42DRAFT_83800 [Trichoderma barbatum]
MAQVRNFGIGVIATLCCLDEGMGNEASQEDLLQKRRESTAIPRSRQQARMQATDQECQNKERESSRGSQGSQSAQSAKDAEQNEFHEIDLTAPDQPDQVGKRNTIVTDQWIGYNGEEIGSARCPSLDAARVGPRLEEDLSARHRGQERKRQQVPEDDWVVVAEDFGVLVFVDES